MIRGIKVILYDKKQIGTDGFGSPVYEETPKEVENVLVAPASATDIAESVSLHGKKAVYTLAIPKGDSNEWEDRTIDFFGEKWKSFGFVTQGIDEMIPLSWNKKVMVERYG